VTHGWVSEEKKRRETTTVNLNERSDET
jgi:hypothetical protein